MTFIPSSINVGSAPNDNTGDPARTAFQKVNDNFTSAAASINSVTPISQLSDIGPYNNTIDPFQDFLVVSRALTSTNRISVGEILGATAVYQYFTAPGTYTITAPSTTFSQIIIYAQGAGGGGGGGATVNAGGSASGGAGGGGGAFCETVYVGGAAIWPTPANISVVVGAVGTAGAGRAAGSAGNGGAGGDGGASYVVDTVSFTSPQYFCYANGGKGGGGGLTGGAASTGGNGGSYIPAYSPSGIITGSFAAGNTDTISTAAANNIVHPWCGGPGTGSSAANGNPTGNAIVMQGGMGGAGGQSIQTGAVKSPGPGTSGRNAFYRVYPQGTISVENSGGAASTTGNGSNGNIINVVTYIGCGGPGGGAALSTYAGGNGATGGRGFVVIAYKF